MAWIRQRLRQLKLLVFDVDGVLTDRGLSYGPDGQIWRRFDARDGLGIKVLQQSALRLAWISGSRGESLARRAQDLGIAHCFAEVKDKSAVLNALQQKLGYSAVDTAFVGDDLNDLVVRPHVGLLITPSDAVHSVRRHADLVLRSSGGQGAVRELAERILRARGEWAELEQCGWRQRN